MQKSLGAVLLKRGLWMITVNFRYVAQFSVTLFQNLLSSDFLAPPVVRLHDIILSCSMRVHAWLLQSFIHPSHHFSQDVLIARFLRKHTKHYVLILINPWYWHTLLSSVDECWWVIVIMMSKIYVFPFSNVVTWRTLRITCHLDGMSLNFLSFDCNAHAHLSELCNMPSPWLARLSFHRA